MLFHRHGFRTLMDLRHTKQQAVANETGLTAAYISQLARNDDKDPSLEALERIAKALDVLPEALYVSDASIRFWVKKHADRVLDWIGPECVNDWLARRADTDADDRDPVTV